MYHPSREMAQLPNVPKIENGKPDFSPTFQKVELRNLTFFQQQNHVSHHLIHYHIHLRLGG